MAEQLTPEKRIALFTGAYNHVVDGVSLTLNRLVSFLESQGVAVMVFAPTVEKPAIDHAGTLQSAASIPMTGRPEYRVSLGLGPNALEALDRFKPTIVHIATPDLLGLQALLYARAWRLPVVASYHTHFSSYLTYYNLGWAEGAMWGYLRWFYRQCEQVYVPTRSMAAVLNEHGIEEGLEIWPRGVDITLFNPLKRSMDWRRSLGFADSEVIISFVSRLVLEKGLDVFAEVVQDLQQAGEPIRCLIVGEGPAEDFLREAIPTAVFLGHQHGEDLSRAYASSDIFLFPSQTETFGNVTLEAMASGLPTVCANATGSASLVLHEETGYLVPGENTGAFKERLLGLVHDAAKRQRMGAAAREEAETYSWPLILSRINAYYDLVLEPQNA
jgi:phosphatidylinositol alpha 1,6-mannosyltransferase